MLLGFIEFHHYHHLHGWSYILHLCKDDSIIVYSSSATLGLLCLSFSLLFRFPSGHNQSRFSSLFHLFPFAPVFLPPPPSVIWPLLSLSANIMEWPLQISLSLSPFLFLVSLSLFSSSQHLSFFLVTHFLFLFYTTLNMLSSSVVDGYWRCCF